MCYFVQKGYQNGSLFVLSIIDFQLLTNYFKKKLKNNCNNICVVS